MNSRSPAAFRAARSFTASAAPEVVHCFFMPEKIAPLSPPRRLLLGPGPSMVAPRVYDALSKPIVGHLDPYFFEVDDEIRRLLPMVFGSSNGFSLAVSGT